MVAKLEGAQFSAPRIDCLLFCVAVFAVCGYAAQSLGASGGWTMFAPTPELQSAVGDKLTLSEDSVIHASGPDIDYVHYAYLIGRTKAKLFIAYAIYSSREGARRNFQRLATNVSWSKSLQVLGHEARYLPNGTEREHMDANLLILIKNEIVMIRGEGLPADSATCER